MKSLSCVRLSDPMDYSLPGSSIHGIFQARVLEWGAIRWQQTGWDVGQFYPRQQGLYSDNKLTQSLKLMTQAHNTNYPHPQHFAPISQKCLVLFQTSTVKQPRRDKLPDQSCKRKKKKEQGLLQQSPLNRVFHNDNCSRTISYTEGSLDGQVTLGRKV